MSLAKWKPRKRKAKAIKQAATPPKKRGPKRKLTVPLEKIRDELSRQMAKNPALSQTIMQELQDMKALITGSAALDKSLVSGKPPSITKELWLARVLDDGTDPADADLPDPVSPKLRERVAANERRFVRNGKKLSAQWNREMKRIRGARQTGGVAQKKKWEIYARQLMEKNRGLMVLRKDSTVARKIRAEWDEIPKGKKLQGEPEHLKKRGIKGIDVPSVRTITSWSKEFRENQRGL
jgi:hypothetical protein